MINEYEQQGINFLTKTNTTMTVKYNRTGTYFDDDKEQRDIYNITLKRGTRSYTFTFGQSINCSGRYQRRVKGITETSIGIKNKTSGKYNAPIGEWSGQWFKNENFKEPTAYDILACVSKYNPGTFEDFCNEFGYNTDSRNAEKTYKAVLDQFTQLETLFNDEEMAELAEIN